MPCHETSTDHLNQALDLLYASREHSLIPFALLARAELRVLLGDFDGAAADLAQAQEMAVFGGMRLYQADTQLETARLEFAQYERGRAHASTLEPLRKTNPTNSILSATSDLAIEPVRRKGALSVDEELNGDTFSYHDQKAALLLPVVRTRNQRCRQKANPEGAQSNHRDPRI